MTSSKAYIATLLLSIMLTCNAWSQDIHFSQYDMSPLNINPAYTGFFAEDLRFIFNHRNQWNSVTTPYKTFSGSIDNKVDMFGQTFGAGLLINQDRAGDSRFGTFQVSVSIANHFILTADSSVRISVGIQPGFVNRSIDYDELFFDNQFDGDVFNEALPTGEVFSNSGFNYFDLSAGTGIAIRLGESTDLITGFSVMHINTPKQSFFDNTDVTLNRRWNTDISILQQLNEDIDIIPSFLFMSQGKFRETNIGVRGILHLNDEPGNRTSVSAGAAFRLDDAFIVRAGLDHNQMRIGLSYDFNTSDLRVASDRKGGFEFALAYLITNVKPVNTSRKVCPVY